MEINQDPVESIEKIEKVGKYISGMRPVLNKAVLYSDETSYFRDPVEPEPGDEVTIRFRTMKDNVDAVYLICKEERHQMKRTSSVGAFDYYSVTLTAGTETLHYYFEIIAGRIRCYYNERGVSQDLQEYYSFGIVPGFKTPDWAKGAVFYQIFVDRFYNGDKSNDVENREYFYIGDYTTKSEDWNKPPAAMGVREFYGGDLQGVMDKLDYLQDLGVEVLYFNPIFVAPSNHKYDAQDYDYVDPHYGVIVKDGGEPLKEGEQENSKASMYIQRVTNKENLEASNALFIRLVEEVHARGMKVILDGAFNHCGSFNKWMDRERVYEHQEGYEKGAYVDENSPYRNFFKFHDETSWPYNPYYDGWWGHNTLPKLNYEESDMLYSYIMEIARKWVSPPFNADGWRLDVAADLGFSNEYNHNFWKEFRKVVKEANPNAIILAEHYGEAEPWLRGDEWDTVMNYDAFMEPVTWFLTGMQKHSDEYREDLLGNAESFMGAMGHHMSSFFLPSLQMTMNELSNHDHSRFLTRTNHKVGRVAQMGPEAASEGVNKAVLREAVVMQMTWPGAPTIYYGDEAGVCGFTDPDNRRTYPWGQEDHELIQFHKEAIRVHKEYKVLSYGSVKFLATDYNFLSYGRFNGEEQIVVAVNNLDTEREFTIPVWEVEVPRDGMMEQVLMTYDRGFSIGKVQYQVEAGSITIKLPPYGGVILKAV